MVLQAEAYELRDEFAYPLVYGSIAFVEGLFTYRWPALSLSVCALWQLVCSCPWLLPSLVPLALLTVLLCGYVASTRQPC